MAAFLCGVGHRAIQALRSQRRAVAPELEPTELARGPEVQTPVVSHPEIFGVTAKSQSRPAGLSDERSGLTLGLTLEESTRLSSDAYDLLVATSSWRSFSADGTDNDSDCELDVESDCKFSSQRIKTINDFDFGLDGEADFECFSKRLKTMSEIPDQSVLFGHDEMEEMERSSGGLSIPVVAEELERDSGAIIGTSSYESQGSSSTISVDSSIASLLESSPPMVKRTNPRRDFPEPWEYLTKSDIVKWRLEPDFAEFIEDKLDKPTRCFRTGCFPDPSGYLSNCDIDRLRRQTDSVELSEGIGEDVHSDVSARLNYVQYRAHRSTSASSSCRKASSSQ